MIETVGLTKPKIFDYLALYGESLPISLSSQLFFITCFIHRYHYQGSNYGYYPTFTVERIEKQCQVDTESVGKIAPLGQNYY